MLTTGSGRYLAVDLNAGRFAVWGLVAALAMLLSFGRRPQPTMRQARAALGISVLGFTGYQLILALAIRDAGSAMPSLLIGTFPLQIIRLGKPQNLRWSALMPRLALTLTGLSLMAAAELAISTKSGVNFWRGIGIAQLALASWTAFAILNSAQLKPHPEVNATDWAHLFGVATGLGALVMRLVSGSSIQALTARDDLLRLAVLYLLAGFGSTWMAAIFWIWPASGLAPAYAAS